jgi:hypothetical protein
LENKVAVDFELPKYYPPCSKGRDESDHISDAELPPNRDLPYGGLTQSRGSPQRALSLQTSCVEISIHKKAFSVKRL